MTSDSGQASGLLVGAVAAICQSGASGGVQTEEWDAGGGQQSAGRAEGSRGEGEVPWRPAAARGRDRGCWPCQRGGS